MTAVYGLTGRSGEPCPRYNGPHPPGSLWLVAAQSGLLTASGCHEPRGRCRLAQLVGREDREDRYTIDQLLLCEEASYYMMNKRKKSDHGEDLRQSEPVLTCLPVVPYLH